MKFHPLLSPSTTRDFLYNEKEMKVSSTKSLLVFILICGLYFLLSLMSDLLLFSDDLVYNYLSEKLPHKQIEDLTEIIQKRKWLAWGLIPIFLMKNFFLVAMCFSTGALLYGYESSFKKFFLVAIKSEFIFLIPIIIKLTWFSLIETDYDLIELQVFSPLSAINLVDMESIEPWYIYPLRLLNVFELLYWAVLAIQLQQIIGQSLTKSFVFVATTYGMGLLLWVLFVLFLTVSVS